MPQKGAEVVGRLRLSPKCAGGNVGNCAHRYHHIAELYAIVRQYNVDGVGHGFDQRADSTMKGLASLVNSSSPKVISTTAFMRRECCSLKSRRCPYQNLCLGACAQPGDHHTGRGEDAVRPQPRSR
jgi:hypothetical protein